MKRAGIIIGLFGFVVVVAGCAAARPERETLTQLSTLDAVLAWAYDGTMTIGELKEKGDAGIGTFHALDGEMTVWEGTVYRISFDGKVAAVGDKEKTPFATVTWFDRDQAVTLPAGTTFASLSALLDQSLPSPNLFYLFVVEGKFTYVKTRSVPAQTKPYPPLIEVTKKQSEFAFRDVEGTCVGLRFPLFAKGLNMPGYHVHFLAADRTGGGHLLDFTLAEKTTAYLDATPELRLILPEESEEFGAADLGKDRTEELNAAER
jgi:acetolactate decarboxylase